MRTELRVVGLRKYDQKNFNLRGIVKIIIFGFKKHFLVRHMGAEMAHKGFLKESLINSIFQANPHQK